MFLINRNSVDSKSKVSHSKDTAYTNDTDINDKYKKTIWNIIDCVCKFTLYEMCHWINFIDRWIRNRTVNNTTTYRRGDILYIDLGATNFRFEPSFTHPCIVLANRKTKILIVPCSSKKFGYNYPDIIDAYICNGFAKNTGIQVEEFRWVNKNRVLSKMGHVSPDILDKINDHMIKFIPTYKRDKLIFQQSQNDNAQLSEQIKSLTSQNSELQNEINLLNKQLQELNFKKEY